MHAIVILVGLFFVGCVTTTEAASIDSELPRKKESRHFVFYYLDGDNVDEEWQETYYGWLTDTLKLTYPHKINYFRYHDRDHIYRITGQRTNAYADPKTRSIHTMWPIDNHECVHLLTEQMGTPTAFFNEGMAVAHETNPSKNQFEPYWRGRHVHAIAKDAQQRGEIPPLKSFLETTSFGKIDSNRSYPLAGSFVRYLLDTKGLQATKTFFEKSSVLDAEATIRANFLMAYGMSVDDAWNQWLQFLGTWSKTGVSSPSP
jgi:hypothetical protein